MRKMTVVVGAVVLAFGTLLTLGVPAVPQNTQNAPELLSLSESESPRIGTQSAYFSPYAQAIGLVQAGAFKGKGFSSFTHPAVGIYCLTVAPNVQQATAPVVSIEWGFSLGVNLFAQWDQANISCGGGTNVIEVRTYKGDTGGVGSGYQIPVLSNSVAFVVVVP